MSGAEDLDAAGLRRAFAAQLEHLERYKGRRYVPDGALPRAAQTSRPDGAGGAEGGAEGGIRPGDARDAVEPVERRGGAVPPNSGARGEAPREDLSALKRRVVKKDAEGWSAQRKLQYLQSRVVGDCQRCPLARKRQRLVFGVGNPEARVMFIGEAPGADEDRVGEPFVGAAGRRLDRWIGAMEMRREDVYIANVLKCRPPGNRDPHPREVETCSPFLRAQIRAVMPEVIVTLGRFAASAVLQRDAKLYQLRGHVHAYGDPKLDATIPVVATYHPSYVLRSESKTSDPKDQRDGKTEEEKVLADLKRALGVLSAPF